MKSFSEHLEQRKIAFMLNNLGVDVDDFCETILLLSKEGKLDSVELYEIWQPISKLARGAAGLFGGAAGMAGDAGKAIGKGVGSALNTGANAGSGALNYVGDKLKAGAQAAGSAIKSGANAVKQGVDAGLDYAGTKMQNSANNQALAQTIDRINGVYDSLKSLGYNQNQIKNATIGKLEQLVASIQRNQARGLNHQDELKRQNMAYQAKQAAMNSPQAGLGSSI